MKKIVYLLLFISVILISCDKEEEVPEPSSCFLVDQVDSHDPTHNFLFTNCSKNYQTPAWDFGDGHTSTDQNPSHRFNSIGQYTVKLTVTNSSGTASVNTRTITIGHYSLTKVIYNKLNATVPYPKHVYFSYNTGSAQIYGNDALINSASQVPFTVTFPEGPTYDLNPSTYFRFKEDNLSGNSYTAPDFTVSNLEIVNTVNYRLDKTFYNGGDSAKVSMYFKIVPR